MALLTSAPALFKPDDVIRTPSGRLATIVRINPDGSRTVQDSETKDVFDIMPKHLALVRAAIPKPWPKRTP